MMKKILTWGLLLVFLAGFMACSTGYKTSAADVWKPNRPKYVDYTKPPRR